MTLIKISVLLSVVMFINAPSGAAPKSLWRQIAPSGKSWRYLGISRDGTRLIATASGHAQFSGDSGASWTSFVPTGNIKALSGDGSIVIHSGPEGQTLNWPTNSDPASWHPEIRLVPNLRLFDGGEEVGGSEQVELVTSDDGETLFTAMTEMWAGYDFFPGYLRFKTVRNESWREADVFYNATRGFWEKLSCSANGRFMVASVYPGVPNLRISTNHGGEWKFVATPGTPGGTRNQALAYSPDGSVLAVSVNSSLYLSKDHGTSWQQKGAPIFNWNLIAFGTNANRIFIAETNSANGNRKGLIYQSIDGGDSWHWSGSPTATWTHLAVSGNGERVIAASADGLYISPGAPKDTDTILPSSISRGSDRFIISWVGTPYQPYLVMGSTELPGQWTTVGAVTADSAGSLGITDFGTSQQKFYQAYLPQ